MFKVFWAARKNFDGGRTGRRFDVPRPAVKGAMAGFATARLGLASPRAKRKILIAG
jgi:hypothetical protein